MVPGAAVDCERILDSWWGQPVNTATCVGFLIGGIIIWRRGTDPMAALLTTAIGVGSIAFHGPMPPWGEFVHDVTIVWALVWVILVELGRQRLAPGAFAVTGLLALTPATADPSQALLAIAVLVLQLRARDHRRLRLVGVGLLAIGALIGRLASTGWPLCDPDSLIQGHGFWHLCSAAALTIWGGWTQPDGPAGLPNTADVPRG
ncbi:MAG TPA: hypothetical protein VFY46_07085 [Acidimicrobiia bacterium]|nr:hypothetical protein [Acidimicrobiia bacterium]